ncbi:hypothetical protein HD598_000343 [Neomicrococcus aestuarii]|uniref:DUF4157 domain-containing protein n=1 Tax=Neomicrococcus aestuarii TaxID=556325 RepID=A0A7W8WXV7_9MICC|nr:DUF4157 domain-containing protein [Neomicrococcus aestuarii]MBB5511656.1 hypothetical protein [Neomicrococcus aestuarii]
MQTRHALRAVLNTVNLATPLGLIMAAVSRCDLEWGPEGLILAKNYRPRLPIAGAFTVGNVIFFRPHFAEPREVPALLAHEARHSWQYVACLGLPFFPLYFAGVAWSLLRTGDPASRNPFERFAGLQAGGYREQPTRSLVAALRSRQHSSHPHNTNGRRPL